MTLHNAIDEATDDVITTGDAFAEAVSEEMRLEDERTGQKMDAIKRLMAYDNPLNGKPHSASSAESQVETDSEYMAFRAKQREAVMVKIRAKAQYEVAKLRATAVVGMTA